MNRVTARRPLAVATTAFTLLGFATPAVASPGVPPVPQPVRDQTGISLLKAPRGTVTSLASPGRDEVFLNENTPKGRLVEHYLSGRWTSIVTPKDALGSTDGSTAGAPQPPAPDLSSADSGQFWDLKGIDGKPVALYHYTGKAWRSITGVPAPMRGPNSRLSWVADLPGDGALVSYWQPTASRWERTTLLFHVSDNGVAEAVGSLPGPSSATTQNGLATIKASLLQGPPESGP